MTSFSKRRRSYRPTKTPCESVSRIDLADLIREDSWAPGSPIQRRLDRPDGDTIALEIVVHYLRMDIRRVDGSGAISNAVEHVRLAKTDCRFGGSRRWFVCPRCSHRRSALFHRYGRLKCRECHGLTYMRRLAGPGDRARWSAQEIRLRLGGSSNLAEPFPLKPHGMRWQTYMELYRREQAFQLRWLGEAMRRSGRPAN